MKDQSHEFSMIAGYVIIGTCIVIGIWSFIAQKIEKNKACRIIKDNEETRQQNILLKKQVIAFRDLIQSEEDKKEYRTKNPEKWKAETLELFAKKKIDLEKMKRDKALEEVRRKWIALQNVPNQD